MRIFLTLMFAVFGQSATAHPGHWAELAGHGHWVAGAAIGLAVVAGLWGVLKGEKETDDDEPEPEFEEETA